MTTQKKESPKFVACLLFNQPIKKIVFVFVLLWCSILNAQNAPVFTITNVTGSPSLTCNHPTITLVATSNHSTAVSYTWTNLSSTVTGSTAQVNVPGTYSVYASAGNYTSMQTYIVPGDFSSPVVAFTPTFQNITCSLSSVQNVTAIVSVPQSNISHEWISPAGSTLLVNGQSSLFTPASSGQYTHVAISNTSGCKTVHTFTVASTSGFPTFSLQYSPFIGCSPNTATIEIVNAQTNPTPGGSLSYTVIPPGSPTNNTTGTLSTVQNYTFTTPGNYYVMVRDNSSSCTSSFPFTISQNTIAPAVLLNATHTEICPGNTVAITAYGADTYTFSGGIGNGITFTPSSTSSFSVAGTNTLNGCVSQNAVITISVQPGITIASNTAICPGGTVALTASGASTYTWSNGITNGQVITPTSSASYTVTGTSTLGCVSQASRMVTMYQYPTLTVVASAFSVCAGEQVTLIASGALTFSWSGGVVNGQGFIPAATASYVVVGANVVCSHSMAISINVAPLPVFTYTLNGLQTSLSMVAGCNSYSWDYGNGQGSSADANPVVTFTAPGTYEICLRCTDGGIACGQCVSVTLPDTGSGTVGSGEFSRSKSITIYPNPFSDYLKIRSEKGSVIYMHDAMGNLAYKGEIGIGEKILDMSTLPRGIYFLSYIDGDYREVVKVAK